MKDKENSETLKTSQARQEQRAAEEAVNEGPTVGNTEALTSFEEDERQQLNNKKANGITLSGVEQNRLDELNRRQKQAAKG